MKKINFLLPVMAVTAIAVAAVAYTTTGKSNRDSNKGWGMEYE